MRYMHVQKTADLKRVIKMIDSCLSTKCLGDWQKIFAPGASELTRNGMVRKDHVCIHVTATCMRITQSNPLFDKFILSLVNG